MDDLTSNGPEIGRILTIYGLNPKRAQEYLNFYTRDISMLKNFDPILVALITSNLEGIHENPPPAPLSASSVAAWGYINVGIPSGFTLNEFAESIEKLQQSTEKCRKTTKVDVAILEQLLDGLRALGNIFNNDDIEDIYSVTLHYLADILENTVMESECDDGRIKTENTIIDFLYEHLELITDHGRVILRLQDVTGRVRDILEETVETMEAAFGELSDLLDSSS